MERLTFQQRQILMFRNKAQRQWVLCRDGEDLRGLNRLNFAAFVWQNTSLFTEAQLKKYNYWRDIKTLEIREVLRLKDE